MCLFQIALCTLGAHLDRLCQVGHEGLEGWVHEEGLLVQAQRVVPLVDLALSEGDDVDFAPGLRLLVVDHLDEVVLLVFLVVRQASTLIDELDLSPPKSGQLSLHVEVIEESEAIVLEASEHIADRLQGVSDILFVFLLFATHHLHALASVRRTVRVKLFLQLIFLLF